MCLPSLLLILTKQLYIQLMVRPVRNVHVFSDGAETKSLRVDMVDGVGVVDVAVSGLTAPKLKLHVAYENMDGSKDMDYLMEIHCCNCCRGQVDSRETVSVSTDENNNENAMYSVLVLTLFDQASDFCQTSPIVRQFRKVADIRTKWTGNGQVDLLCNHALSSDALVRLQQICHHHCVKFRTPITTRSPLQAFVAENRMLLETLVKFQRDQIDSTEETDERTKEQDLLNELKNFTGG